MNCTFARFFLSSRVSTNPPSGIARASQVVEYPPGVPTSKTFLAPAAFTIKDKNLLCAAETEISGKPPSQACFCAASRTGSSPMRRELWYWSDWVQSSIVVGKLAAI
ncbi:hypothetical protein FA13DRAFT_1731126 [Coprinellus micaceus]|uniref:Uncharacterized protein n=1 Tax=Coprinellus micaceus TaxID=71717 RepID=A0A4Y7TEM8_COPMI|nr:hypothetical protein FA13DRAFT_1731126 [Coprinellus micaceus]